MTNAYRRRVAQAWQCVLVWPAFAMVATVDDLKEGVVALMAIHPGEHLAEELKALEMSAAELARKISVPTNRVTQILNGTRSVTGDTALRLGHFFGTSPQFWLNLQTLYDVRIAEHKAGKAIRTLPRLRRKALVQA